MSAMTAVNVSYIARKLKGAAAARQIHTRLLAEFRVCPLGLAALNEALASPLVDYEDAVQLASAHTIGSEQLKSSEKRDKIACQGNSYEQTGTAGGDSKTAS